MSEWVKKVEFNIGGGHWRIETDGLGNGDIETQGLKVRCPFCGVADCYGECDQAMADVDEETMADHVSRREYNAAVDGIESLVLAHACAGLNVGDPAYQVGLETAFDAIGQAFPQIGDRVWEDGDEDDDGDGEDSIPDDDGDWDEHPEDDGVRYDPPDIFFGAAGPNGP